MPLNDERPSSTSSSEEQSSDDLDCSRDSCTSDASSKQSTPSSSPPKSQTLDEVMESARDMSNLRIFHEITVNRNFHLDTESVPQDSLWKVVKDTLHKAFWDVLESELNDDPPQYGQAIRLLEEIRETLLSFLNPGANRMRTQISEFLDMELIRQQADNQALDIQRLASYVISTMGKMCAPVRDDDVQKLRQSTHDMVTLFREIFRVLDLMKADIVNFSISYLRTVTKTQSVEYERSKFQSILDKNPNGLEHTTQWVRSALEGLLSTEQPQDQGKGLRPLPGPFQILNAAFLSLLTWDYQKSPLPETWMTDEQRLREVQQQLQQSQAVNQVLLMVHSTIGEPIQGLSSLSDRLKRMTSVLLDEMHNPGFNTEEALEGVSAQICCELNKSLTERQYPALTPALQATLRGQICGLAQKDNPIRTLVEDRVQKYFMALICDPKPEVQLEQAPAGLTAIKPELAALGEHFISLVNYNKTVYGHFYVNIIKKLLFSSSPPAAEPPHHSITSN